MQKKENNTSASLKSDFLSGLGSKQLLLIALLVYAAIICLVSPFGNFPINDDFVYGLSVKHLLETGQLDLYASAASCYLHILLGAFVSFFFGYSFETLRFVTLTFGLVAIVSLYLIQRELGIPKNLSIISTCAFAVNPLVIHLEFSYMTDISAIAVLSLSQLFLLKAIKLDKKILLVVSSILLLASILIRQTNVILIVPNTVLLLILLAKKKFSWTFLLSLIVAPLVTFIWSNSFMLQATSMPNDFLNHKENALLAANYLVYSPTMAIKLFFTKFGHIASYLGLFCMPVLFGFMTKTSLKKLFRNYGLFHAVSIISCFVLFVSLIVWGIRMPYSRNLLRVDMLGSPGLVGQLSKDLPDASLFITILSAVFATILFLLLGAGFQRVYTFVKEICIKNYGSELRKLQVDIIGRIYIFMVLFTTSGFLTFQMILRNYDRYTLAIMIPTLSCIAIISAWIRTPKFHPISIMMIVIIAFYSIGQENNYMNTNRARWKAISMLESAGVSPKVIDGGSEYTFYKHLNLWENIKQKNFRNYVEKEHRGRSPGNKERWFPIAGDDYVVSCIPLENYKIIKEISYTNLIPSKFSKIYILAHESIDSVGVANQIGKN